MCQGRTPKVLCKPVHGVIHAHPQNPGFLLDKAYNTKELFGDFKKKKGEEET